MEGQTDRKKRVKNLILMVVSVGLLLSGCRTGVSQPQSAQSTPSVIYNTSAVSDPLDLVENPIWNGANRSVRIMGGEKEILEFLNRYAEAITTLNWVNFYDICADTAENAMMTAYIRYRMAFSRVAAESRQNYKLVADEISRAQNGNELTVTITFEQSYDLAKSDKRSLSTGYEWNFVLDTSTRLITSVKELPPEFAGSDQWYEPFVSGLKATGLPLETPQQVHAAGDEVIRYYYKNGTLPQKPAYLMADGKMPKTAYTVALPYTDAYQLVCVTPGFSYGITHVGLADKSGKLIFDVNYRGIGVTENGYFILCRDDFQRLNGEVYIVVGSDGVEVARYHGLDFYTGGTFRVYEEVTGIEISPVPPYAALRKYMDGTEEYWLLDKNFKPVGESYESLILTESGATAIRDGVTYHLDITGAVVGKE